MARWALIRGKTVSTVVEAAFQPTTFGGSWVECPPQVGPGWKYEGGTFFAPTPVPVPPMVEILNDINALRAKVQAIIAGGGA